MSSLSDRHNRALDVLRQIEQELPIGEVNGRHQRSFADAIALLGKPIEDYTVGELLALAEQHHAQWCEGDPDTRAYRAALAQRNAEQEHHA